MTEKQICDLDLKQIIDSGQSFRMEQTADDEYKLIAMGRMIRIRQNGQNFTFDCGEQEFEEIWAPYFDLDTDYGKIKDSVDEKDVYLRTAVKAGYGVRVLRQDIWEMIVTFLISQNNNITRIKKSVDLLCKSAGAKRTTGDGEEYFLFPTAGEIADLGMEGLSTLGLGYRDKYIDHMAQEVVSGRFDPDELKRMEYGDAHKKLTDQYGIGKKVADCICLFGLHHVDAFPIDTHVKKILEQHYQDGFPFERYKGYAGILQQYMFYYNLYTLKHRSK